MQKKIINTIIVLSCFMICFSVSLKENRIKKQEKLDLVNSNCVAGICAELSDLSRLYSETEPNINIDELMIETVATSENESQEKIEETVEEEIIGEVNNDELELLAHLIWSESGVLGDTGMYYTGSVVLNRVNDSRYPNSIYDVIYQRGQYAVSWNGCLWGKTPTERTYEIARDLLVNGSVLPSTVLGQANFSQMDGVYTTVGSGGYTTYYCYLN